MTKPLNGSESRSQAPTDILIASTQIQLLLSEKRTALSLLRTGIAVFALPLSVLSLLVATSRYYEASEVMTLLLPLLVLTFFLTVLGVYLIVRAVIQVHRYDRLIQEMKRKYSSIAEFVE
jgi:uncharacterized membrane protein YidH (DUF202 family)